MGGGKDEYEVAGAALASWLRIAVDLHMPDWVVFERPLDPRNMGDDNKGQPLPDGSRAKRPRFFTSYESIRVAHGLAMVAGVVIVSLNKTRNPKIELSEAFVQSWRGRFIGGYKRRQADGSRPNPKQLTIARCYQLGWRLKDDNAADACGIWGYVKSEIEPGFLYDNGTSPFIKKKAA